MSHTCPDCGMYCTCDMEDHESDAPDDCCHECEPDSDDADIGVVACYHQYIMIDGVLKCAVCNHDFYSPMENLAAEYNDKLTTVYKLTTVPFIIGEIPESIEWSEPDDPTTLNVKPK